MKRANFEKKVVVKTRLAWMLDVSRYHQTSIKRSPSGISQVTA